MHWGQARMIWFNKWLLKKFRQAQNAEQDCLAVTPSIGIGRGGSIDSDATMSFTVYNAIGGKVVEFRRYDRQRDRSEHTMYVISSDEDFGSRISKIATLETLKN
jgi:hypothetical protein